MGPKWPPARVSFYAPGGIIQEADMCFNDYYVWSTTGAPGAFDVQNVATHEFGHFLPLRDLYAPQDSEQTMYGYTGLGETKKRSLEWGDLAILD